MVSLMESLGGVLRGRWARGSGQVDGQDRRDLDWRDRGCRPGARRGVGIVIGDIDHIRRQVAGIDGPIVGDHEAVELARAIGSEAIVVDGGAGVEIAHHRPHVADQDARTAGHRDGIGEDFGHAGSVVDGGVEVARPKWVNAAAVHGQAARIAEAEGPRQSHVVRDRRQGDGGARVKILGGLLRVQVGIGGEGDAAVDAGREIVGDANLGRVIAGVIPHDPQRAGDRIDRGHGA